MEKITKCLNEWNATLEALGQGKQTILIRKYTSKINQFLLFPTTSYAKKIDYSEFKDEFKSFAHKNILPDEYQNKKEVKYVANLEKIIKKQPSRIGTLNSFHIWTNEHVKSYLGLNSAYVWILRVYKLKEPVMTSRTKGLLYANTMEEIALEGMEPVLSDAEFSKIVSEIEEKR